MHLLVGLGNPGPKYAGNRHNIGFMAVDELVRRHGFSAWRKRFHGEAAEGVLAGGKVLALKPMTFMNDSGRSVGDAMRFHDIDPARLIVFYDELDLDPGKIRVKLGGGAAGHNGIRSLIAHVGPHFQRVRIGIGHPGDRDMVYPHVLSDFAKDEKAWLTPLIEAVGEHAGLLVAGQDASFQNKVHLAVNPPPPKDPTPALRADPPRSAKREKEQKEDN